MDGVGRCGNGVFLQCFRLHVKKNDRTPYTAGAAAGASAPGGMTFKLAVDDATTMHIALPMGAESEVSIDEAETFAGAGVEATASNTTQSVDAETTEVEAVETTTTEATEVETTVAVAVEVAMVPGFVT